MTASRLIDLSWPLAEGMPLFPGDPPPSFTRMGSLETHGYLSHRASLVLHSGTHVDAPGHVLAGAPLLADLPLRRFQGPGLLLDLRGRPGLAVTAADLAPRLEELAAARPSFVLLRTGDEARWGREDYFTAGSHLTEDAARLVAALPGLSGLGLDAASADALTAADLPAHRVLAGAGLLIVENLRGLAGLPEHGAARSVFEFWCLPVLGLDGSPVRAAALLPAGAA